MEGGNIDGEKAEKSKKNGEKPYTHLDRMRRLTVDNLVRSDVSDTMSR
jgi:hypothetical protein